MYGFLQICTYDISAQKLLNGVFSSVLHDCEQKHPSVLCYFLCIFIGLLSSIDHLLPFTSCLLSSKLFVTCLSFYVYLPFTLSFYIFISILPSFYVSTYLSPHLSIYLCCKYITLQWFSPLMSSNME